MFFFVIISFNRFYQSEATKRRTLDPHVWLDISAFFKEHDLLQTEIPDEDDKTKVNLPPVGLCSVVQRHPPGQKLKTCPKPTQCWKIYAAFLPPENYQNSYILNSIKRYLLLLTFTQCKS